MFWFQLHKFEDLLLFLFYIIVNEVIFEFWTVSLRKKMTPEEIILESGNI